MKIYLCSFVFLIAFSCKQSKNNLSEKKSIIDSVNNNVTENDSLKKQLLYDGQCSYILSETKGWNAIPNPKGFSTGARVLVLYEPDDYIQHNSVMGVYSNVISKIEYKKNKLSSTFNEFLVGEKSTAKEIGEKVIEATPISLAENKTAIVRHYFNEKAVEYFAIAYIDEPEYIIMIIFTTRNFDDFKNNYNSFEQIVKSYKHSNMTVIDTTDK